MAQTFLTSKSFQKSAESLDKKRLHNQKVEGLQILTILKHYRILADYLNIPNFPIDQETTIKERDTWMNSIISNFKELGCVAIHVQKNNFRKIMPGEIIPIKRNPNNNLIYQENLVIETTKKGKKILSQGPVQNYVLPDDEYICMSNGFSQHPAVRMWLGFETALKAYINAHIEEWIKRGCENNMIIYDIPKDYKRPQWTYSKKIIYNYRAALIQREIENNELGHYILMKNFVKCWARSSQAANDFEKIIESIPRTIKILPGKSEMVFEWSEWISSDILLRYGSFKNFIWP